MRYGNSFYLNYSGEVLIGDEPGFVNWQYLGETIEVLSFIGASNATVADVTAAVTAEVTNLRASELFFRRLFRNLFYQGDRSR